MATPAIATRTLKPINRKTGNVLRRAWSGTGAAFRTFRNARPTEANLSPRRGLKPSKPASNLDIPYGAMHQSDNTDGLNCGELVRVNVPFRARSASFCRINAAALIWRG